MTVEDSVVIEVAEVELSNPDVTGLVSRLEAALAVIREADGCGPIVVLRGIEDPAKLVISLEWATVEHHMTFRETEAFATYRSLMAEVAPARISFAHFHEIASIS